MPELCRFLGIVIRMFYRDHEPAHFHAVYGSYEITIGIADGAVQGDFPKRALGLVLEWYQLHQHELSANWTLARDRKALSPIPPLE